MSDQVLRFLTQGGALILHGKDEKPPNSLDWFTDKSNLVSSTEHECKIDVEVFKKYAHRYDNSTHNPRPVVPPLLAFQA